LSDVIAMQGIDSRSPNKGNHRVGECPPLPCSRARSYFIHPGMSIVNIGWFVLGMAALVTAAELRAHGAITLVSSFALRVAIALRRR
jgi:hypothetical protein